MNSASYRMRTTNEHTPIDLHIAKHKQLINLYWSVCTAEDTMQIQESSPPVIQTF